LPELEQFVHKSPFFPHWVFDVPVWHVVSSQHPAHTPQSAGQPHFVSVASHWLSPHDVTWHSPSLQISCSVHPCSVVMPEPSSLHCITEFSRQNWVLGVHTMVRQLAVVPEARQYWVLLHVCTVVNTRPSDEHCCTFFPSQV